jgi:hypothetical protein
MPDIDLLGFLAGLGAMAALYVSLYPIFAAACWLLDRLFERSKGVRHG